jgi:hypothetical protein
MRALSAKWDRNNDTAESADKAAQEGNWPNAASMAGLGKMMWSRKCQSELSAFRATKVLQRQAVYRLIMISHCTSMLPSMYSALSATNRLT